MAKPKRAPAPVDPAAPVQQQVDMAGVPVQYATPPEVQPPLTKTRGWLELRSIEDTERWRAGFVDGAVGSLEALRRGETPDALELELRRRFGDAPVDTRLRQLADQRPAGAPSPAECRPPPKP